MAIQYKYSTMARAIALLGGIIALSGCGASRSMQQASRQEVPSGEAQSRKRALEALHQDRSSWHGIKASLRAELNAKVGNLSSRINLSAVRGEGIRLSVMPLPFVEIARVWFTPEGITLVDLVNARYVQEGYSTFSEMLGFELSYSQVEALLLGHVFIPGASRQTEGSLRSLDYQTSAGGGATLSGIVGDYPYRFELDGRDLLTSFLVDTKGGRRILSASYPERTAISATSTLPSQTMIEVYEDKPSGSSALGKLTLQWTKAHEADDIDRATLSPRLKGHYQRITLEQIFKTFAAN